MERNKAGYAQVDTGDTEPTSPTAEKKEHAAGLVRQLKYSKYQGVVTLIWNLLCVVFIASSIPSLENNYVDLLYLYYQPLVPMVFMLWLWGLVVRYFELRFIRYDVCFSTEDQKYLLASRQIFQVCGMITTVFTSSCAIFTYSCATGQINYAAYQPLLLYGFVVMLFLLPANVAYKDTRLFFSTTFWRVVTPFRGVSWADFLLADILTSLAKALSDSERAVCHLMTGPVMEPAEKVCTSASFLIPLGLALPYLWRFCQCVRVYMDTGNKGQVYNAIKYSTAFPVIVLSAIKYQVDKDAWNNTYKPLWIACALLNSAYSYFWDIERDWEIQFFTAPREGSMVPKPVLSSELLYQRSFYYYLMVSNLCLRLAWTYKLSPHLRRHQLAVFAVAMLEAFRRFQWSFVRIEVELRKLQHMRPELGKLVPAVNKAAAVDNGMA